MTSFFHASIAEAINTGFAFVLQSSSAQM